MRWRRDGSGRSPAWFATRAGTVVTPEDLAFVADAARESEGGVARLCLHLDRSASQHDMIVALSPRAEQRVHRHPSKPESVHVMSGRLEVLVFDDARAVVSREVLAPGASVVKRLDAGIWHQVSALDDVAVFHESRPGPFDAATDAEYLE